MNFLLFHKPIKTSVITSYSIHYTKLYERLHQYVDNLNLLYVAFTRSCETLIVMAEQPSENRKLANASHLLLHVIEHLPFETSIGESPILLRDGWNVEDMVFRNNFV